MPRYDGRNRSFFFFSYEGLRRVSDASATLTVPTPLERSGDFSKTLVEVRNPITRQLEYWSPSIYMPYASTTGVTEVRPGTFRLERAQFPGNRVPAALLNATSLKLINYFPLPNIAPTNPDGTGNYFDSNSTRTRTDQIIVKIDQHFSQAHRSFFRYTTDWSRNDPANRFREGNLEAGADAPTTQFNPSATIGHTWIKSARDLFDLRLNMTRINLWLQPSSGLNSDLAGMGFSPQQIAVTPSQAFPRITLAGYPQMGLSNFALRDNHTTNFAFTGSYTRILNRWSVKVGGEYRPLYNNFYQAFVPSMAFIRANMTAQCTGSGCPNVPYNQPQGHALADFLIGSMDGDRGAGQFTTGDPRLALRNSYAGFYSQNDWRATRNLTINLGIRWDYQGPLTERYNRLSQFDRAAINATGTPGMYVFPTVGGLSRGQTMADLRNWGPRVGFAWRALPKTVIRSAYGISYDMVTGVGSGASGFGTDGFGAPAFIRIRPSNELDILDRQYNNAFSGGGVAIGANPADPRLLGQATVMGVDRDQRNPYVQQWNFTVERELPGEILASAAYVGTKGTRLIIQQLDVNGDWGIPEAALVSARQEWVRTGVNPLTANVANPFFGVIPPGNATVSGPTIQVRQLLKQHPAHTNVRMVGQRFGSSSYQGLQLSARRSFRNGFQFGANYTWSKNIDFGNSISVNSGNTSNGGGASNFTITDFGLERSVANSDIPHRLVLNYVFESPYKGSNRTTRMIFGGWKLAGITTFSAGLPLTITGGAFGRPDLVADPVLPKEYRCFGDGVSRCALPDGSSIVVPNRQMLYFNPRAYRTRIVEITNVNGVKQWQNDLYWWGNAPRFDSRLRGMGVNNFNFTASRLFKIAEKISLEYRLEAVNAFNRVEFADAGIGRGFGSTNLLPANGPIDGTSTSATFGTLDVTRLKRTPRYMQMSLRLTF